MVGPYNFVGAQFIKYSVPGIGVPELRDLRNCVTRIVIVPPDIFPKKLNRRSFIKHALFWGGAGYLGVKGFVLEPDNVQITYHIFPTQKLGSRVRIVHLTDLHLDEDTGRDRVPDMVNSLYPDVVLLTGDYINRGNNDSKRLNRLRSYVDRISSRNGVFATFGNWDEGLEDVFFVGTKVTALRDEVLEVHVGKDVIRLVGMDFSWDDAYNAGRAAPLLDSLDKEWLNILLYHSPDLIEDIATYGNVDLYLAGHTHGGQVRLPLLGGIRHGFEGRDFPYGGALVTFSRFGTKYESGRFQVGSTTLYVSRGIGLQGGSPPVRLFCPPEIAVFDLLPNG